MANSSRRSRWRDPAPSSPTRSTAHHNHQGKQAGWKVRLGPTTTTRLWKLKRRAWLGPSILRWARSSCPKLWAPLCLTTRTSTKSWLPGLPSTKLRPAFSSKAHYKKLIKSWVKTLTATASNCFKITRIALLMNWSRMIILRSSSFSARYLPTVPK